MVRHHALHLALYSTILLSAALAGDHGAPVAAPPVRQTMDTGYGCSAEWFAARHVYGTVDAYKKENGKSTAGSPSYAFKKAVGAYSYRTVYHGSGGHGGVYNAPSSYQEATLQGWQYETPDPGIFRLALAYSMECYYAGAPGFGDRMERELKSEDLFTEYRKKDGSLGSREAKADELTEYREMGKLFLELRADVFNPNPHIRSFLVDMFNQMRMTELALKEKHTFSLTEGLIEQAEFLHSLARKDPLTKEEKEFLAYVDKFTAEPRFSFLLHPMVTTFFKNAVKTGVVEKKGEAMNPAQFPDVANAVRKHLPGADVLPGSPEEFRGRIVVKEGKALLQVPDLLGSVNSAVDGFEKTIATLPKPEQVKRRQQLQNDLLYVLNAYDKNHHVPNPRYASARHAILNAVGRLSPGDSGSTTSEAIGKLSAAKPDEFRKDLDTFHEAQKKFRISYDPSALANYHAWDPALKKVFEAFAAGLPDLRASDGRQEIISEQREKLVVDFLKSGTTTAFIHVLMEDVSWRENAIKALEGMGGDKEATAFLKEVSSWIRYDETQAKKYRAIRSRVRDELIAVPSANQLTAGQKASLIVLALLDEQGLEGVTPRDDVAPSNPEYYQVGALYSALKIEKENLQKVASERSWSAKELEDAMFEHVFKYTGHYSGLTPDIRRTLALRVSDVPAVEPEQFIPRDIQIETLDFAKRQLSPHQKNDSARRHAERTFARLVYQPVTPPILNAFTGNHLGADAYHFFSSTPPLAEDKQAAEGLRRIGFFNKLTLLTDNYSDYAEMIRPKQLAIAEAILDFARAKLEQEKNELRRNGKPADEKKAQELMALEILIDHVLVEMVKNPNLLPVTEALANALLGNPSDVGQRLLRLGFKPTVLLQSEAGLAFLKNAGIANHLQTRIKAPMDAILAAHRKWETNLINSVPGTTESERILAQLVLGEFHRYKRAMTGAETAVLRNGGDTTAAGWRDRIKNYFREVDSLPLIASNFAEGSPERAAVEAALAKVANRMEAEAKVKAAARHGKEKEVIAALTDHGGAFFRNGIDYNPSLNAFVVGNKSLLTNEVLTKLATLGEYNVLIESKGDLIPFSGQSAVNDWIRSTRFSYGYDSESAQDDRGGYPEAGEKWLPLNEKTAVRVFRHGDGTYHYAFSDVESIRAQLDGTRAILVHRRSEWLRAQQDYASSGHAAKSYFGAVVGIDPNQTSETVALGKRYNEMTQSLGWVAGAGHITDSEGMSGDDRTKANRGLIGDKLKSEAAAIESFIGKVEVIHDITALIVTLPAGGSLGLGSKLATSGGRVGAILNANLAKSALRVGSWGSGQIAAAGSHLPALLQATLVKAATSSVNTGSRFAARALLTTGKAARSYQASTTTALKAAGIFTAIGTGVELTAMGLEHVLPDRWVGEGPRLIRDKMELFNRAGSGGKWRKYARPPLVADFGINPDKPDPAALERYRKAMFEYEIEEAMDPDGDGVPGNHTWMDQTLVGTRSPDDIFFSPVEQFASNWKFFQGLNISKAAIPRGGLMGEMAFANLWNRFHPLDPTLERSHRQERARMRVEESRTGKPARERSIGELAFRDVVGGGVEGLRFGVSGLPTQAVMGRLGKGRLSAAAGALLFVVTDEASKHVVHGIEKGKLEWPWADPNWTSQLGHSVATGSYIGYSMARGAQHHNVQKQLKERYLGIRDARDKGPEPTLVEKPIAEMIKLEFGNNPGEAILFLRSITPEELARAPKAVQAEFFAMMKEQGQTALKEVNQFITDTHRKDLKPAAETLTRIIPEISDLANLLKSEKLSPEQMKRLKGLRLEQEIALQELQTAIAPLQAKAARASKAIARVEGRLNDLSPNEKAQYEANKATVEEYAKNGFLVNQAVIRLNTIENFQQPIETITAVSSPDSVLAQQVLGTHPNALRLIKAEETRRREDPTAWERSLGMWKFLEEKHVAPKVTGGGSYFEHPQGFTGQTRQASNLIQAARAKAKTAEERSELLDVLRLVDPKAADRIERTEKK